MEKTSVMDNNRVYGITEIPAIRNVESLQSVRKYWGSMLTIFDDNVRTVKLIKMHAGTQSSLEFHCKKQETYFIKSGRLRVGLRTGRGVNSSIVLNEGDSIDIEPGLMHMRIAETDVEIIEISTPDDDRDSHIVEDGQIYKHAESK